MLPRILAIHQLALPTLGCSLLLLGHTHLAIAGTTCPNGPRLEPDGQEGSDIQFAIQKARPGDVVLLSGVYKVYQTIRLQEQTTLCSEKGSILKWVDQKVNGVMLDGYYAPRVTLRNIVFDGRGVSMGPGGGHDIENNLFKNIPAIGDTPKTWPQRLALYIVGPSPHVKVRNNHFQHIGDTGIMAYGLDASEVSDNTFQDANEGAHLWTVKNTLVARNSGTGFYNMALEVQGDDLPGVVIQDNTFTNWQPSTPRGNYGVSVVSGNGTLFKHNTISVLSTMGAALEVGAKGVVVSDNTISNGDLVIEKGMGTVVDGNTVQNASILKDVNRVSGSTLTITNNRIINPPIGAIHTDYWYGYDQIHIEGNQITKQLQNQQRPFRAIDLTANNPAPLKVLNNTIVIKGDGKNPSVEVACFFNAGSKGDMRGTLIEGNTCESDGAAVFTATNGIGGHIGVIYRNNILRNLKAAIIGDSSGFVASGNKQINVQTPTVGLSQD